MRDTIDLLKQHGELKTIEDEVDINLEIPHIAYIEVKKEDSKALLFTNPVDKKNGKKFDAPVLVNLFGSAKRVEILVGDCEEIAKEIEWFMKFKMPEGILEKIKLLPKMLKLKNISPKKVDYRGISQEVVKKEDEVDLFELPILTTWEEDGGPFITMGQVYTTSLDGNMQNLGMYRLQVYSKNRLGLHWQIHKDSNHFFHQYKKAGKKMPVSIAIGGDPLYTWCGTAPLPIGVFELLLYGFVKNKKAKLAKSITNPIYTPEDADFVIEGWVDPAELEDEGPFGDHTGYYTPIEPYPVLQVSAITRRKNPVYLATVVGKPPLEDKYLGFATERIFLPLLKTTAPDLIDYYMPENGVFHNLIIAKIAPKYPSHAKQIMHAFWGVGQMSFVKHAIFVGEDAPSFEDSNALVRYMLESFEPSKMLITEGVCDALDHASPMYASGGKLGVDCTEISKPRALEKIEDKELEQILREKEPDIEGLKQYFEDSKNPICVVGIKKQKRIEESFENLVDVFKYISILVFVDIEDNDLDNAYMLLWRVVNNIDAKRDIYIKDEIVCVDATKKGALENHTRGWPKDTDCTKEVIDDLMARGLIDVDKDFLNRFQIISSRGDKRL